MENAQCIMCRLFLKQKIHSGVILSGIYSRIYLCFWMFWLIYMSGCRANAMLRTLRGMQHRTAIQQGFYSEREQISSESFCNATQIGPIIP